MEPELKKNRDGNLAAHPITGWTTGTVAGIGVLLQIEYLESPQDIQTGHRQEILFGLTPQQSLHLAEVLTKLANKNLQVDPGTPRH